MLKKSLGKLLLIILVLAAHTAMAAETRIGVVNTSKVLKDAPQAEAARKKLESEFAPRDAKIVEMQKSIKTLEDQLAKNSAIMSEAARKKSERDIVSQKRDVKRAREEFTEDFNFRRNEELGKLQKLVYETILSIAKDEKFDIILGESVLYASNQVDITDKVLEQLRKAYNKNATKN